MGITDRIRLSFNPGLRDLNIDEETLKQILANRNFREQYKSVIKPFIKHLQEYKYTKYENGTLEQLSLDSDTIKNHINVVFELSMSNSSNKYCSFIKNNNFENRKFDNYQVFNDSNFDKLYSMIGYDIFNDNICEIIMNGHSNRLIEFLDKRTGISLNYINNTMFEDKVWNVLCENPTLGDRHVLDMFKTRIGTLIDLINNDYFEGLKYSFENIPESQSFISAQLGFIKDDRIATRQFSMDFINNIGIDTLKQLYSHSTFYENVEFNKLFEITDKGNYELVQDIVNYDNYDFSFKNIKEEDMDKKLIETDINDYNKKEVFLNKYFGISRKDVHYVKVYLDAINKVRKLPDEFMEKYGEILKLLGQIYSVSDEEIISISKTMDSSKKDSYNKLIKNCELDGNEIIKGQFVKDLKDKNEEILENADHKSVVLDGKSIDIYELSGQPFTMLVHAISDNNLSVNNSFVSQLVENPENWDKMEGGNNHISTSLISDKYMITYGIPDKDETIMFGFNDLPDGAVRFTDVIDAGIDRKAGTDIDYNMRNRIYVDSKINTVATVDDVMEKTIEENLRKQPGSRMWNEIGLTRRDDATGKKIMPNYIVCMDRISKSSLRAAERLNIPIYLINRKYYKELPYITGDDSKSEVAAFFEDEVEDSVVYNENIQK